MAYEASADVRAPGIVAPGIAARGNESPFSGVSWGAIIAGGVVAAAMALILSSLGAGLGLLALSPWKMDQSRAEAIGIGTIIWSIIVEIVAFGIGGYVAGRLRTKWAALHGDEVYFRDTAHGFVVWALGTLLSASLVTSAIGAVGHGAAAAAGAGASVAGVAGAATAGGMAGDMAGQPRAGGPTAYFSDMLLRSPAPAGATTGATTPSTPAPSTTPAMPGSSPMPGMAPTGPDQARESHEEVSRILVQSAVNGGVSDTDKAYLAQVISTQTGMSQDDAKKRVDDVTGQMSKAMEDAKQKAKEAADATRKTLAGLALWGFVSMLIGAFTASYMASRGGRARDLIQ